MNSLINNLIKEGYLRKDEIIDAFSSVNRMDFLPAELEKEALSDIALPIGYGQTISQPKTVAIMLDLLDPKTRHNILDVGSGSGWTTALLAHIAGDTGKVTAIERIDRLKDWGEGNVKKYDKLKDRVMFLAGDGTVGYPENGPYDRILVSASAKEVPSHLINQLKVGGKLVIPVGDSLTYLEKENEQRFKIKRYPGFIFVPLV